MEHVNHPKHYNQHPAGIECIDIIRHYTCDIANAIKYLWRAGLKAEMGMKDAEKEIEDLKKALWYINDFIVNEKLVRCYYRIRKNSSGTSAKDIAEYTIYRLSGHSIDEITKPYTENVADAMRWLLIIGVIDDDGKVYLPVTWRAMLNNATYNIQARIDAIQPQLIPLKPEPPTFKEVDIKAEVERWDVHSGFTGTVDIAQRRYDCPLPYALSYEFGPCQTKDEVENQQISILERIAADCMAMADFIKKTQ